MLKLLIGIIVIIIIVALILYFYQRKASQTVANLADRLTQLKLQELDRRLDDSQAAGMMGKSLKDFISLQKDYRTQLIPLVKQAQTLLLKIQQNLHGVGLFSSFGRVNELKDFVEEIEKKTQYLNVQLTQNINKVEHQQRAVTTINDQLLAAHRRLDEHAYEYGNARNALQDRLAKLSAKLAHFNEVNQKGDYTAAAELLEELQEAVKNYQGVAEEVPDLYRPLFTTFPDQLEELRRGYHRLIAENYHFPDDHIETEIDSLEAERQTALDHLSVLEIDPVRVTNKHLAKQIDHLYDLMQTEIDARPRVEHLIKIVGEHLDHACQQNRDLMAELDRLSASYTFHHDELATTRSLGEELKQIRRGYERDQTAVNAHSAIASQILDQLGDGEKHLTAIESQQKEINDGVIQLQDDERRARQALQRFVATVRATKRRVENLNLPGLPQAYLDFFFLVSDEIDKLTQAINKEKVDMEEITRKLLVLQEDVKKLLSQTNELRDMAGLTAYLIQYGTRFVMTNETLGEAIDRAQVLFNQREYKESLETIGSALEKVEPGAFKRLENSYYRELDQEQEDD